MDGELVVVRSGRITGAGERAHTLTMMVGFLVWLLCVRVGRPAVLICRREMSWFACRFPSCRRVVLRVSKSKSRNGLGRVVAATMADVGLSV